jgi:hypothetical protein
LTHRGESIGGGLPQSRLASELLRYASVKYFSLYAYSTKVLSLHALHFIKLGAFIQMI